MPAGSPTSTWPGDAAVSVPAYTTPKTDADRRAVSAFEDAPGQRLR